MSTKVAELNKWLKQDDAAAWVSGLVLPDWAYPLDYLGVAFATIFQ
jgi:hypothetical protein